MMQLNWTSESIKMLQTTHLVLSRENAKRCFFVGSLPSFFSGLLGSASHSDEVLEKPESPLAAHGSPQRTKG